MGSAEEAELATLLFLDDICYQVIMVIEKCQHVCVDNHNYTGMVKKVGPRLRELALTVSGSQDAGSRNLGPTFYHLYMY